MAGSGMFPRYQTRPPKKFGGRVHNYVSQYARSKTERPHSRSDCCCCCWMLLLLNKDYCWIDLGAVTLVFPKPNAHFWDFLSFRLRKTLTSQTGWFVVVAPGVHFSCFKNHCFYSTFAIATSKNHCFSNGFCEASFKNRCFYNGFWIGAAGLVGYFSLILSPSKALLKYDTFSL